MSNTNENVLFSVTRKSSGDMSSHQYKLVTLSTTNDADGVIVGPSSAGGFTLGIWQGNSTASEYGRVAVLGISKAQVSTGSAPVSPGSRLTGSTATHGAVTVSTSTTGGHYLVGYALEAHSSGSSGVISVLLVPSAKDDLNA